MQSGRRRYDLAGNKLSERTQTGECVVLRGPSGMRLLVAVVSRLCQPSKRTVRATTRSRVKVWAGARRASQGRRVLGRDMPARRRDLKRWMLTRDADMVVLRRWTWELTLIVVRDNVIGRFGRAERSSGSSLDHGRVGANWSNNGSKVASKRAYYYITGECK